jgi:hypothetical protein
LALSPLALGTHPPAWHYRQQTWPESVNPYLFTHARSWWLNQAVSPQWIRDQLSLPAQSIRFDRILDEAHATGGDIRRLMDLFGISAETAHCYVRTLTTNLETTLGDHSR